MLNYIIWDPSDTALRIGHFALHWYSLCWLIGLLLAYLLVRRLYREQKIKDETKATIRCIPVDSVVCKEEGTDIYSGKPSHERVVFAIAY